MAMIEVPKDMWALLNEQPLLSPPPGITPNFSHPTWYGITVVIAASICFPIMLLVASMRIYTKCYIVRKWGPDDNIFLLSLAAAIVYMALSVAVSCGGAYGYHAWDFKIGQLTKPVLLLSFVILVSSGPLVWLIKLGVFSLIFHAFRPLAYIRGLVYFGILTTGLYHVGVGIANGVICGPRGGQDRASFMAGIASPKCGTSAGPIQALGMTSGVISLFSDIFLFVLPLPAISKLNLPRRRKVGILLIFSTGAVGCVMGALALYYRTQAYGNKATMWNSDITYSNNLVMTVTIVESAVGVMIPCMASCAKLFKHTSSSVTSFVSSRFTGFRRTTSIDNSREATAKMEGRPETKEQPHTDTIDRMMMQFRPTSLKNDGRFEREGY